MPRFNFEKNLPHQEQAVNSTVGVFDGLEIRPPEGTEKLFINPFFDKDSNLNYVRNIGSLQEQNSIERNVKGRSNIIDVMMETGTGKTYTYTKTIFELNKRYGVFKFVVIVPTLPIKAGAIDFLNSDSAREHFKEQYGKTIKLHVVESKKGSKTKKSFMPPAVSSFVNAGSFEKNTIQVLIINSGMINSDTMSKNFDATLLDKYAVPFEALAATKPFMIIDEPHKFGQDKKTWINIQKIKPQIIIRYGATFKENENLIYQLTAVDSFNRNLVKGVVGHITEFEGGKNTLVKLTHSDGTEASFQLTENGKSKTVKLSKNGSLEKIHSAMKDLWVEKLNKTVVLSNGLELKKGDKFSPYSYSETLQETMIQKAVQHHFELEKEYLKGEVKIKPLTLFFIDNIEEYRKEDGSIKQTVEKYIKAEVKKSLKTEEDTYYKHYLNETSKDVSKTHGGYFAVDKKETDEVIEKEVNEILHDKQSLLDLENPRRFIFSKWTLREGWDNPNVFQICKLRSSGSEISKLQEVGRGLRLPVNQYGNRVKDESFFLNYFVDFTESDFVEKLVNEINEKSGAISIDDTPADLTKEMIKIIGEKYNITENDLLKKLDDVKVINRDNSFKENGFEYIKKNFPLIFSGVGSNKIRNANSQKTKITIREGKYQDLEKLWEKINEKVVLEYKIENEKKFKDLFIDFLKNNSSLPMEGMKEKTVQVEVEKDKAIAKENITTVGNEMIPISTMKYHDFLKQLSTTLNINLKTIHECFKKITIEINKHLNQSTIRNLKQKFDSYLMTMAFSKFCIEYQKITNTVHPTLLTDKDGKLTTNGIDASKIGVSYFDENVPKNYLFEKALYDSELEKENIKTDISEVIVFTKIPKNTIRIPIAGGKSYSPDFAYVLNWQNGKKKLNFIVETKGVAGEEALRAEEKQRIKHAQKFFEGVNEDIKVEFKTQFQGDRIADLIREIIDNEQGVSKNKTGE